MRVIVTVLGKDKPGIIAKVSTAVFNAGGNILDISQTVLRDEIFAMTMLVDMIENKDDFSRLKSKLDEMAEEMNLEIKCQREEIFNSMHRV